LSTRPSITLCVVPVQTDSLASRIRDVPDFPKPGILFKDITTLLKDGDAFTAAIDGLLAKIGAKKIDAVVGMESRGFIFAAPIDWHTQQARHKLACHDCATLITYRCRPSGPSRTTERRDRVRQPRA